MAGEAVLLEHAVAIVGSANLRSTSGKTKRYSESANAGHRHTQPIKM
jgi:hypothetical protein